MPQPTHAVIPADAGIHFPADRRALPLDYSAVSQAAVTTAALVFPAPPLGTGAVPSAQAGTAVT